MRRSIPLALATVLAVLLPPTARAQRRGAPTFEAEIDVVNLSVSVTDAEGQYVTDLKADDFAVFEDGVRQKLSLFSNEDQPISLALLIDGSASMLPKMGEARAAAAGFVKTLHGSDRAELVEFNDRITVLQAFTSDLQALQAATLRTSASGPTALHNALYASLKELAWEKERTKGARRRAIVILSDGEDTASLVSDEQVIDLAKKSEIGIYPIMLRDRPGEGNRPAFSQASYLLDTLAQQSGGRAFVPNSLSELDGVYGQIAEELRTLYSVGYVSENPRRDGKWRRIVVRLPQRSGLLVRHKLGYYAHKR